MLLFKMFVVLLSTAGNRLGVRLCNCAFHLLSIFCLFLCKNQQMRNWSHFSHKSFWLQNCLWNFFFWAGSTSHSCCCCLRSREPVTKSPVLHWYFRKAWRRRGLWVEVEVLRDGALHQCWTMRPSRTGWAVQAQMWSWVVPKLLLVKNTVWGEETHWQLCSLRLAFLRAISFWQSTFTVKRVAAVSS